MIIRCDRQQSFINRAALLSAVAVFALTCCECRSTRCARGGERAGAGESQRSDGLYGSRRIFTAN